MPESTTMVGMNTTEPTKVGETQRLAAIRERLEKRGVDMRPTPPSVVETPEEARQRDAHRMEVIRERWARKVPAMYASADVTELDGNQHAVAVRSWLGSGALHLVLAGPVGTGKTHAAYAIGNQALNHGTWTEAWSVGDLMEAMRPGADPRTHAPADLAKLARTCQLLVLDDLIGKASEWEAEQMTLLLDARVREQRRTIVTTNMTSTQITETWGGRFMDRLTYRLTALTFSGESRRGGAW
jgi:DNA replication protein DnaC